MKGNPVLVEVFRGPLVESRHRGALAIVNAAGKTVASLGDIGTPIFPRSAIKALQALPFIETGAADSFDCTNSEIAIAAASHAGLPLHTKTVGNMLSRAGLSQSHLACGIHRPLDSGAMRDLVRKNEDHTALHNNCSGKHSAMLLTAAHLSEPLTDYWRPDHPVQLRVRRVLEELTDYKLPADIYGIDGCSLPNWPIPLQNLASAFARFISPDAPGQPHAKAARRIMQACQDNPDMIAGPGRLDTEVMKALPGDVFLKTGAEGTYCAGLPRLGIGMALKIDDGAKRAAELIIMQIISAFVPAAKPLCPRTVQRNWQDIETGRIAHSGEIEKLLAQIGAS